VGGFEDSALVLRAARLYFEEGKKQGEVSRLLGVSQATVSRLLRRGFETGVVRVSIHPPQRDWSDLEEALRRRYGLSEVRVVEPIEGEELEACLGRAGAEFVGRRLGDGEVVGLSSWSHTLLAMVRAMRPIRDRKEVVVAQILGGLGNPSAEIHAYQLTSRFSSLVSGEARFLPAPGVAPTPVARRAFLQDRYARETQALFSKVTMALVGIGGMHPSKLIAESGNVFSERELETLRSRGAVGDVCMRFYDEAGEPVSSELDGRVIGMDLAQLARAPSAVGVAGGLDKLEAIRGALRGAWINTLITDSEVAKRLLA